MNKNESRYGFKEIIYVYISSTHDSTNQQELKSIQQNAMVIIKNENISTLRKKTAEIYQRILGFNGKIADHLFQYSCVWITSTMIIEDHINE